MAARTQRSSNFRSPAETLRRIQDLGSRLTGAARSISEDMANSPAGRFIEPMARIGASAVELSTMWVAPMRAILEEQQQLIDAVASWAAEQRKLADRFAEIADRHRALTNDVMSALGPTLDQLDALAGRGPKSSPADRKPT